MLDYRMINPMVDKIEAAKAYRADWEDTFHSKQLYDFYESRQYKNVSDGVPYILNLIYTTVEEMKAKLLIKRPAFLLDILPGAQHWNLDLAAKSAQNKEDLLNALIMRAGTKYPREIKRCFVDSMFGFGIFETGYSADLQNPNSPAAIMTDAEESPGGPDNPFDREELEAAKNTVVPENDNLFYRRIKHWRFLVSDESAEDLSQLEWYGYYFYVNKDILKNSELYKGELPNDLWSDNSMYEGTSSVGGKTKNKGVKLWRVWNNITKTVEVHLNNGPRLSQESFDRSPITDLRWSERSRGFYPIPPIFMWIPSQNEMNNSRQMMKANRQKAITRWGYVKGKVTQEEIDKFLTAVDQSLIAVSSTDAIFPLNNPGNGQPIKEAFLMGQQDFNKVAGVSDNEQGVATRTTATEAKIISDNANAREADVQDEIGNFYGSTAKQILTTALMFMDTPVMVQISNVPTQAFLADAQPRPEFGEIIPANLQDNFDFSVSINPAQGSVFGMQQGLQSFIQFFSLITQFPFIALDPELIAETAFRCGYRNMRVIAKAQQAALMQMIASQGGGAGQSGSGTGENGDNTAKRTVAQAQPNDSEQVRAQLDSQMG